MSYSVGELFDDFLKDAPNYEGFMAKFREAIYSHDEKAKWFVNDLIKMLADNERDWIDGVVACGGCIYETDLEGIFVLCYDGYGRISTGGSLPEGCRLSIEKK